MMDDFDFGLKKIKNEGELEVTGVSRSGRVRKKSSKLTDFENLDELEMRTPGKAKKSQEYPAITPRTVKKERVVIKEEVVSEEEEIDAGYSVKPEQIFIKEEVLSDMEFEQDALNTNDSSLDSMGSEIDDLDEPEIDPNDPEGFQSIAGESEDANSQAQSLYMLEKSTKKKLVIKDGKIVGRVKAHRKDKGKTRFTAYMLWAKEIRSELIKHNPELDFSQTSKKLGELWASVPLHEKYIWKRRAKRIAARGMVAPKGGQQQMILQQPPPQQHPPEVKKMKSPPARKYINKQAANATTPTSAVMSSPDTPKSNRSSMSLDSGVFKPVGTTPLDVAAHLKLLGESLTIIGERLTEHEGQIAVSGSISVLLDSLLCALAPLICLTQQVPQMNVVPQEQLSQLMDNIAYLMPGL